MPPSTKKKKVSFYVKLVNQTRRKKQLVTKSIHREQEETDCIKLQQLERKGSTHQHVYILLKMVKSICRDENGHEG